MIDFFGKRGRFNAEDFKQMNSDLDNAFAEIRQEMEDHLDTINENTNEIQGNHEYLSGLNSKIDKLSERLDNLQMFLKGLASTDSKIKEAEKPKIQPLTSEEKRIFLLLYTSGEVPLSYKDLAERISVPEVIVRDYITTMIEKGVAIQKEYRNSKPFLKIDHQFRELQAKENIIGLAQKTLDF
ncbi:hypothetical protein ACFLYT_01095 [Nanoarchaeota archaeon]